MKLFFIAAFALFVLSMFDKADSSAYDKIVAHSRIRARKEGPNVCALQQVMGTKKYFSTCRNWYNKSICGRKATVLYECCPGYMKLEGMHGCPAVAPIDDVYGTLGVVKATSTQRYSEISKLRPEIEGSGSYTFFAPSNEAWDSLDDTMKNALVSNVNVELYNALHYHMSKRRLLTKDLKNGMTVPSMNLDLDLYINHYPNGVVTVNCARIIHGNQVATNGVVHVIDRVISAVGNTIQDVIENDDELSTLSDVAQSAGVLEKLGQPGQYTLFAPTNKAFEGLGQEVLERLRGDKGALKALVNFHLLDSVQCSEAIMSGTSYETMEGSNVIIGCDGESLTVNGIKMVLKKDIVTTNGVIHLIDKVLMPDSAKQVMELVGDSQSTFRDMVAQLGLSSAMRPKAEYTLLAPHNDAFSDEVMSKDQRLLRILLENHILKNKVVLGELYNGQHLETIGGKLLRVFIYRTAVCIENSCLIRGSKEGINGALHITKTLLKPSEKTIYEILMENGRFKIFLSLMEAAEMTDLLKQEGDFTLFAPSDEAFAGLTQIPKKQKSLILRSDCGLQTLILTFFGLFIPQANKTMQVNSLQIPESDIMGKNGVIHFVNHILYPGDIPVGSQSLLSLLRKMITNIQIKLIRKWSCVLQWISSSLAVPDVTKFTRVVQSKPTFTKLTIEGIEEPSITEITRLVQGMCLLR
uniref:Periostin, osteoblast specific factor b n=1 Tax=Takifugu rubripes TaxID=31033 RepID=A0A674PI91_TAKRU